MSSRRLGILHLPYLVLTGLLGWALVIYATFVPNHVFGFWQWSGLLALCLFMATLARLLTFRLFRRVRIALDSAFYISTAFVISPVAAAWMVLVVFSVEGIVRYWRGEGLSVRGETPLRYVFAQLLHKGGLPALVLMVVSAALGLDVQTSLSDQQLFLYVPLFAICFLVIHYFLAGGSHWFSGTRTTTLLHEFFLKVIIAEVSLVPLALSMVLGYVHQGIELYLLLGSTCLVFNVIFRRAIITSEKLHARVEELTTINNVGRLLSGSLERRVLVAHIAAETLRLVGQQSQFCIGLLNSQSNDLVFDLYDEYAHFMGQRTVPKDDGLPAYVMQQRRPLLLADVPRERHKYIPQRSLAALQSSPRAGDATDPLGLTVECRSWLGVPLLIYDEVLGVIVLQNARPKAFGNEHLSVLATIADQAAVALENARLYELATVDGLTGLLVRRYFDQRLLEEWQRTERYHGHFTLGIFDLDDFKRLNDSYGHQAGDLVLRAAARVFQKNMRGADIAGRFGGEEFAFILPRTRSAPARVVAERIRRDIEAMRVPFGEQTLQITASIGIAGYPECGALTLTELVARADEAMYQAKHQGKNRIYIAGEAGKGAAQLAVPS